MRRQNLRVRNARLRGPTRTSGPRCLVCLLLIVLTVSLAAGWNGEIPAARADGGAPNLAYVVGGGKQADQLVVLDIAQRSVAWSVTLGGQPEGVVLSTDARFAYIPEASANRVAIVDTSAHRVIGSMATGSGPAAIAVDPSGSLHWLFVANANSDSLTVLDADTQRARATLAVGREPVGVAVASAASGIAAASGSSAIEVYVANRVGQSLSVFATSDSGDSGDSSAAHDLRMLITIPLPARPCALTIPATGGIAYVATCTGTVLAVGLASHRVLGTLYADLGGTPGPMDYDAVTGQIYVPVPAMNRVVILRPAAMRADGQLAAVAEPLRTLTFAGAPSAVAITFDGALGFVAGHDSGQVVELDVTTRRTLGTVAIGGAPRAIVTGPYPPALNRQTASVITAFVYAAFALALVIVLVFMVRRTIRDNIQRSGRSG